MPIRLVICCRSRLLSEGLRKLLEDDRGIEIGGVFYNSPSPEEIAALNPDVVLVDLNNIALHPLPQCPEPKVVLIDTGMKLESVITALVSHRLSGVLSPSTDIDLLRKALRVISNGEVWIDNPTLKELLLNKELMGRNGSINGITSKQRAIIKYICEGYTNREIASRLFMSEQTVKSHLSKIFRKFNVNNRSQLVMLAVKHQLYQYE